MEDSSKSETKRGRAHVLVRLQSKYAIVSSLYKCNAIYLDNRVTLAYVCLITCFCLTSECDSLFNSSLCNP